MGRALICIALSICAAACAGSPETVVHVAAPHEARWEVRDAEGDRICTLPCSVELDEHESVSVERADGARRFVVRQENLGPGAFSASVRVRREHSRGTLAARVFGAALSGAGSALQEAEDREHVAAGVFLSGVGAATQAASEALQSEREELWVQRSSSR